MCMLLNLLPGPPNLERTHMFDSWLSIKVVAHKERDTDGRRGANASLQDGQATFPRLPCPLINHLVFRACLGERDDLDRLEGEAIRPLGLLGLVGKVDSEEMGVGAGS